MAEQVSGTVEQVSRVDGPGGNTPKWRKVSLKIKGEFYSGFLNPKDTDDRATVSEGDQVEVQYVLNGRYKNIESVKITGKATAVSTSKTKATAIQEYVPSALRDLRITVAGARNSAMEFVRLALDSEAIALKSTKGKKVDELLEHVNYYTKVFVAQLLAVNEENARPTEVIEKEVEEYSE